MKLSLCTVIFSHLSDVQEINTFVKTQQNTEEIRMRINFVKLLVSKLNSGVKEMSEEELNKIWKECNMKFGKRS